MTTVCEFPTTRSAAAPASPFKRATLHLAAARRSRGNWRGAQPAILMLCDLIGLSLAIRLSSGSLTWLGSAYIGVTLSVLALAGEYRPRLSLRLSGGTLYLLSCLALPLVPLTALLGARPDLLEIVQAAPMAGLLVLAGRATAYAGIRAARARHHLGERTLIIGTGQVAVDMAGVLLTHAEYGLAPVGFVDGFHDDGLPLPVLGDVESLDRVLQEFEIGTVIVAFGSGCDPDMVNVLRACNRANINIHVVPRFFELGSTPQCRNADSLWGIPVVRLRPDALRSKTWRLKRVVDVLMVSLLLPVTAPLFALIALAVRITSPGPIFFRQTRVGQGGRPVEVLKFRSLMVNDDADTTWSVTNDDRQTSIGRLLRKSSLDELPQLLNVLKGDMSLVGPRPERPHFVSQFDARIRNYNDRHRVPVGMTGWAQIHGLRGDTSLEERARFDNGYIEHWSLSGDLMILIRTFTAVVRDLISPPGPKGAPGSSEDPPSPATPPRFRNRLLRVRVPERLITPRTMAAGLPLHRAGRSGK